MSRGRKTASVVCAAGALAATFGAIVSWRARAPAAAAVSPKARSVAAAAQTVVADSLRSRQKSLELEVKAAAAVPQLKAALGDRVDSATIVDLFEDEDWWAPFRSRAVALVTGNRILAVRGDKEMPLPSSDLLARAREGGVASEILGTPAHVVVGAVAPLPTPRDREQTFLLFGQPLDSADLRAAVGAPILISDGHTATSSNGGKPEGALAGLVGREGEGIVADPSSGWLAIAVPAPPRLWLWVLKENAAEPPPTGAAARWLVAMAILLGLAALGLPLMGGRAAAADADAAPDVRPAAPSPAPSRTASASTSEENAGPAGAYKRRGTLRYVDDELGHRPTAVADSDLNAGRSSPSGTPRRGAQAVAAEAFPDRARVETNESTFGRYRLIERLGEGGMAEIYTAVMHGVEGFRRIFVVKRLRPEVARNRAAVDQFIDEAKLGSTFSHPNIVPVFDFGKVGDEYFMAQEYIIGRDMTRFLQRHVERTGRALDERIVLFVAHEVLDALSYAHALANPKGGSLGLVHRDISPGNVMVTARGEVKLFDFGIVKAEGRLSKTDVGVVKGNVSFMSPEQARGHAVDSRSDLFSLGLVMYYCLTNDPLYPGENTFDQLMKAATGPKTEHLRRLADLPPVASSVMGRALSVDPDGRYQNAAEFAAALAPHIAGAKAELSTLVKELFDEEFRRELLV